MSDRGWKEALLRSGVPLEYEAAKVLVRQGMHIDADFAYMRKDPFGANKEFSVDLKSTFYGPKENDVRYRIQLLIECKSRSPDKRAIFIPEPNAHDMQFVDPSISAFDFAQNYRVDHSPLEVFASDVPVAYKAVEIHKDSSNEDELRSGIHQIRYSVPYLLKDIVDDAIFTSHQDDRLCEFICSILIVNSELRILNNDMSISKIRNARDIEEISKSVDVVSLYSLPGPDFFEHCKSVFKDEHEARLEAAGRVQKDLRESGPVFAHTADPVSFVAALPDGHAAMQGIYHQFLVTNLDGFEAVIRGIKNACLRSYSKRATKPKRR